MSHSKSARPKPAHRTRRRCRIPHGCDGTATLKVRAQIPEGVIAVKPMPKAGWQIETVKGKYDKTYPYYHGQQLTEGVKEIVWSGGKLPDEHYDEFVFAGFLAGDLKPGPLYVPVTQECEKGEARWADVPAPGQDAHALKAPAPALVILAQQHGGGHAAMGDTKVYKAGVAEHRGAVGARDARRRQGRRRLHEDHQ